jgi:hypothetical protein
MILMRLEVMTRFRKSSSEKILSNIAPKQAKTIKVNWWKTPQIRWSAAASVVLVIGLWFGIPQFTKDKTELALEKVSNAEIKSYLETQDLSYLEYESATETAQNSTKVGDNKVLDGLNIDKKDILEHLETQDLEDDIFELPENVSLKEEKSIDWEDEGKFQHGEYIVNVLINGEPTELYLGQYVSRSGSYYSGYEHDYEKVEIVEKKEKIVKTAVYKPIKS